MEGFDEIVQASSIGRYRREDEGFAREDDEANMSEGEGTIMEEIFREFDTRREDIIGFHRLRDIEGDDGFFCGDFWSSFGIVESREDHFEGDEREGEDDSGTYPPERDEEEGSPSIFFHEWVRVG